QLADDSLRERDLPGEPLDGDRPAPAPEALAVLVRRVRAEVHAVRARELGDARDAGLVARVAAARHVRRGEKGHQPRVVEALADVGVEIDAAHHAPTNRTCCPGRSWP